MHNPESIEAWLGDVAGYGMGLAVNECAVDSINASKLVIGAAGIASGRKPS